MADQPRFGTSASPFSSFPCGSPSGTVFDTIPPVKISPRSWAPAALSALFATALYAITLGGTYIYDDAYIVGQDPRVRQPSLWGQFWTHDWFNGGLDNLYRPLVSQSFGIQMWLHGDRRWAFHLVNILLHAGASALVAELARRLAGWRVGLFAGLLFACHPIHSEAVAGIVGRAELACAVGVLGAMVLFLKQPITTPRALAIFAVSLAAMLCKEQAFLLPVLLFALVPVRRHLFPNSSHRKAEHEPLLLAFALVIWSAGGLIVLREEILKLKFEWSPTFLTLAIQPLAKSPPTDRWLIPLALLGRYFQLLVAPVKLSIDYGAAVIGSTISRHDPYLWLGIGVAAAWAIAFAVCLIRRRWVVSFCLLAMAVTYFPASNIVMIATIFGERLMYLPSAFFVILIALFLTRLSATAANALLVTLLLLTCLRTWTYVQRWNDRDSFYQYSLIQQPKSMAIHLLVADVDYEENKLSDARRVTTQANSLCPDDWQMWKMSALIDERLGEWPQAEADWKRAFDLYPAPGLNDQWAHAMGMANQERSIHPLRR
jgi:protein O-mannosyl-transferase